MCQYFIIVLFLIKIQIDRRLKQPKMLGKIISLCSYSNSKVILKMII